MKMEILINNKDVFECSHEELLQASALLKEAITLSDRKILLSFHTGLRVSFFSEKADKKIVGTIERINVSSVTIKEDYNSDFKWKISPGLLTIE